MCTDVIAVAMLEVVVYIGIEMKELQNELASVETLKKSVNKGSRTHISLVGVGEGAAVIKLLAGDAIKPLEYAIPPEELVAFGGANGAPESAAPVNDKVGGPLVGGASTTPESAAPDSEGITTIAVVMAAVVVSTIESVRMSVNVSVAVSVRNTVV